MSGRRWCPECPSEVFEEIDLRGYGCPECGWVGDDPETDKEMARTKRVARNRKTSEALDRTLNFHGSRSASLELRSGRGRRF
jgi:hypothetical protein